MMWLISCPVSNLSCVVYARVRRTSAYTTQRGFDTRAGYQPHHGMLSLSHNRLCMWQCLYMVQIDWQHVHGNEILTLNSDSLSSFLLFVKCILMIANIFILIYQWSELFMSFFVIQNFMFISLCFVGQTRLFSSATCSFQGSTKECCQFQSLVQKTNCHLAHFLTLKLTTWSRMDPNDQNCSKTTFLFSFPGYNNHFWKL